MRVTKVYYEGLKAIADGYRTIVFPGSSRSGKTYGIMQIMDRCAVKSQVRRKLSIVAQSYNHLEQGAIEEYNKYLYNEGLTRAKGKNLYRINKSIMNYFSLGDEPGKAVGPGRNILYLNEPNRGISYEAYFQLKRRTNEFVILDYNPSGKFWLHTEGILDEPRTKVIHTTWRDNVQNLTRADIEDFLDMYRKSKSSDIGHYHWKVYGLGEDAVLLEERIMPLLKRVSKVPDDAVEIPSWLDLGWFPHPTSMGRMFIKKGIIADRHGIVRDKLYVQQLIYDTKISINVDRPNEGSQSLITRLNEVGYDKTHQIIMESADPRVTEDLRQAGFSGVEAVKKRNVEQSIRKFHDYDIYVVDGSEETYTELDEYKFKRDRRTNEILGVPAEGQADHSIDGIRYVLMSRGTRWSI